MNVDVFIDGNRVDVIEVTGESISSDIATINRHYKTPNGELTLAVSAEDYEHHAISVDMLIDEVTENILIKTNTGNVPIQDYGAFDIQ